MRQLIAYHKLEWKSMAAPDSAQDNLKLEKV